MPNFMRRAKYFFPHLVGNYEIMDQSILLKTIKVPQSLKNSEESRFWEELSMRLPKPAYKSDKYQNDDEDNDNE
jgi:FKBP-type peptidyl-prolyl cis-trans isomerase (trigger factor)